MTNSKREIRNEKSNRNDEPEVERSLLGLEDVEDVRGVPRKLVQLNPNFLLRVLDGNVDARHGRFPLAGAEGGRRGNSAAGEVWSADELRRRGVDVAALAVRLRSRGWKCNDEDNPSLVLAN